MSKTIGVALLATVLLSTAPPSDAQPTGKIPRIGFLDNNTASGSAGLVEAFRQELSKLGWIEGKNISIEYRFSEQKPERQARRPSRGAADQVRVDHQPQSGEADRLDDSAECAGESEPGHKMTFWIFDCRFSFKGAKPMK